MCGKNTFGLLDEVKKTGIMPRAKDENKTRDGQTGKGAEGRNGDWIP